MAAELPESLPFAVMRRTWQPVAISRDLAVGATLAYRLLDTDILVARFPGGLLASQLACPHKGMRLDRGQIVGGELHCCYHGWRFDSQGACTTIPSLPAAPAAKLAAASLATFEVRERYGMIWVKLDAGPEAAPLPEVPEFEDPRWSYRVADPMPFASGFRREIENYLDMTHFAFAHSGTLGVAARPTMPEMDIVETADGFEMNAPFPALDNSVSGTAAPGKLQQAHHRRQHGYLPNFTTIRQTFGNGDERVLVHIPSPNTHESCTVFWSLAISPGFDGPPPEAQMAFAVRVLEEDRFMCENQLPKEVPLKPSRSGWGVMVTPGDTLSKTFQLRFRQFLLDHHDAPSAQ